MNLKRFKWSINSGIMSVMDGTHILMRSSSLKNLQILKVTMIFGELYDTTSINKISRLWHNWLIHMSEKSLIILHKETLLSGMKQCKLKFCEYCVFDKLARFAFDDGVHSSQYILDYIHFDVWNILLLSFSQSWNIYYLTFVDDYSRFVWIYFMQHKYEIFEIFKNKKIQAGKKVAYLRIDNITSKT